MRNILFSSLAGQARGAGRRIFGAGLVASTAIICPSAVAQSFSDPDFRYAYIGPGNVEISTGRFTYDSADLSVGSGDFPNRLEFRRVLRSTIPYGFEEAIGQFTHNFNVSLGCTSGGSSDDSCLTNERAVRIGGATYIFTLTSGIWTSKYADGALLEVDSTRWIFTKRNGERIIFPKDSAFYNYYGSTHLASLWEFPSGEFLTFSWEVANGASYGWNPRRRLARVVNSRGYGFQLNYLLAGGGTTNWPSDNNVDYRKRTISSVQAITPGCSGSSTSCDPSQLGTVGYGYTNWSASYSSSTYQGLRLDSVTHAGNAVSTFTWTANRKLRSESNPAQVGTYLFVNDYDASSRITQQTDPVGNVWLYRRTLDGSGNTVAAEVENPLQQVSRYGFVSGNDAPSWIDNALGKRMTMAYDSYGRITKMTSPLGKAIDYAYDARGNLVSRTTTPAPGIGSDQSQQVVSFTYPPCDSTNRKICNKPSQITDERLNVFAFTYSAAHGGIQTVLGPATTPAQRPLTRYSYGQFTRAPNVESTSAAAPLPDVTLMTQVETCLSSDGTASYTCPSADALRTTYSYDASSPASRSQFLLNTVTTDPGGINATTTFRYDIVGNTVAVDGPRADGDVVQLTYDLERRVTRQVAPDPDGSGPKAAPETGYDYDAVGNLTAVRRKLGGSELVTAYQYNAANQAVQVTDPVSGTVTLTYDKAGRSQDFSQMVEGQPRVTRKVYDTIGRLIQLRKAVGILGVEQAAATNTYDDDGNVIARADANGNTTNYCIDGFGRTAEVRFPSSVVPGASTPCSVSPAGTLPPSADLLAYHYDAAGNPVSVRLRDGQTILSQFDAQNRPNFKDAPGSDNDTTMQYDLAGRPVLVSLSGANAALSVASTYDKAGRLTGTTSGGRTLNYGYDIAAGTTSLTWPDGQTATYKSDPLGRTTEIDGVQEAGYSPIIAAYDYDQLSRRNTITLGNATSVSYSYDSSSRLSRLAIDLSGTANDAIWNFAYNEAGQLKTRTLDNNAYAWTGAFNVNRPYSVNGLNQYTQSGGRALSYDGRGNLIGDGVSAFMYDAGNRMTSATGVGLTYDALGRLARITANGISTSMLYDGLRLVAEYDDGGNLLRRYVHGPAVDEPLVVYEGGSKRWHYQDRQGSVVALADASGSAVAIMSYGEFGEPSQGRTGRFAYTGQTYIPEIGVYYYKARMYSFALGRFFQTDPVGYTDGMNWYDYAHADPLNQTDPTGMCGEGDSSWPHPCPSEIVVTAPQTGGFGSVQTGGGGSAGNGSQYFGGLSRGGGRHPACSPEYRTVL